MLDPNIMAPRIPARSNDEPSVLAEMAVKAAKQALETAGRKPACSSATFGIETARGLIAGGQAKSVLVVNPEICTAHLNLKDRDAHFIFGDVATALLVEDISIAPKSHWEIIGSKLITKFSNKTDK